jgi:hypothetical protein
MSEMEQFARLVRALTNFIKETSRERDKKQKRMDQLPNGVSLRHTLERNSLEGYIDASQDCLNRLTDCMQKENYVCPFSLWHYPRELK